MLNSKTATLNLLKAAPDSMSAHTTIRDVTPGWPILREGSNGRTCFPGVPVNQGDKHPMCNDQVWMNWLDAVVHLFGTNFEEWIFEADTAGTSYMLRGDALEDNSDPTGSNPNGLWDQEGPHIMMLFATLSEIAHLPRDPNAGGPYVM